ncbi:MAG: hypothetical protein HOV97_05380 [Nonomuraea sp.]|nr:hypothetical protein [Nonomuraea sp.]
MPDRKPETAQCASCGEAGVEQDECPASNRPCGHHCNHVWEHDECCWCLTRFGEGGEPIPPALTEKPNDRAAVPTGMCGRRSKCDRCPSEFLCYTKAMAERDLIAARVERPYRPGGQS